MKDEGERAWSTRYPGGGSLYFLPCSTVKYSVCHLRVFSTEMLRLAEGRRQIGVNFRRSVSSSVTFGGKKKMHEMR